MKKIMLPNTKQNYKKNVPPKIGQTNILKFTNDVNFLI